MTLDSPSTPDFPSDVDVAIVAHDNLAMLPATLQSVAAAGCPPHRITVVDVASTDGTGDWLAAAWPAVRVRRLTKNDGPSPGRNAGIVEAAAPYVLLMDADVVVRPDAVQRLRAAMAADPKAKVGSGRRPLLHRPRQMHRDQECDQDRA